MNLNLKIFVSVVLFLPLTLISQKGKKKADKDTYQWRYEIEGVAQGLIGTYQIKVWSYSRNTETAIEQSKKNAVHGIIFRGYQAVNDPNDPSKRIKAQPALARNPNLEIEHEDFFKDFFATGGKYLKFVSLVNNGRIGPGDLFKISKKEYKVGVVISVNVSALRKDLEASGIIKSLSSGF
tara:strand:+ start:728 stop:1267 length:540 start_codon:yes stop_codon:yes gene_type:complete